MDAVGGVLGDALQDIDEIIVGVDLMQPTGNDQALDDPDLPGAELRLAACRAFSDNHAKWDFRSEIRRNFQFYNSFERAFAQSTSENLRSGRAFPKSDRLLAEQPGAAPHGNHPQGAFEVIGVDRHVRVGEEDLQSPSSIARVGQRPGQRIAR